MNSNLAWKIYETLKAKGAEIGNASVPIIQKVLDENEPLANTLKTALFARLEVGNRWMVWDAGEWVVYGPEYGQRGSSVHIRTEDEAEAVAVLTADD